MRRFFFVTMSLLALGCTEKRTEVVAIINKYGITVGPGGDVDAVELVVKAHADDPEAVFDQTYLLCADGNEDPTCLKMPMVATLVPGPDHPKDPVVLRVLGMRDGKQVIGDQATFHFLEHASQRLDFVLYANCLGVDCTMKDKACNYAGDCEPVAPSNFNGEPQLDGIPPNLLPDLGAHDLAGADFAGRDLAGADLAQTPTDMQMPMDLRMPQDMAMSHDMARSRDMAMPRDMRMSSSQDMTMSSEDMTMSMSEDLQSPNTWAEQSPPPSTSPALRAVWGWDANEVWAVGGASVILHTLDGGSSWSPETINDAGPLNLNAVSGGPGPAPSPINTVYAVGDGGVVLQRQGDGTWNRIDDGTFSASNLRGVWVDPSNSNVWVVGSGDAGGFIAIWDGTGWNKLCGTASSTDALHFVWGRSSSEVYLGGFNGQLRRMITPGSCLNDSGTCSCPAALSFTGLSANNLQAISGGASGSVIVVGDNGATFACDSGACGLNFAASSSNLRGVWTDSGGDLALSVGDSGTIQVDTGATWSAESSGVSTTLRGVWGVDFGPAWAVGDNGVILRRN